MYFYTYFGQLVIDVVDKLFSAVTEELLWWSVSEIR